ncbi:MAG: Plug domain-containing protein, partial [Bacteroidota bacterium]
MPRILGIVLVFLFIGEASYGQVIADTLNLSPVPLYSSHLQLRLDPISPWPMELDSSLNKSGALDLGALLQQQGLLHIKDYGPGRLSTLTLRGGSAGQSQVVWNGIPLNAPTLGLLDLSTLPTSNAGRVQFINRGEGA